MEIAFFGIGMLQCNSMINQQIGAQVHWAEIIYFPKMITTCQNGYNYQAKKKLNYLSSCFTGKERQHHEY